MRSRAAVLSLLLLAPVRSWAQSPIEILGRAGSARTPADAGVEAPSGPADCAAETWTFEVALPNATIEQPSIWASAGFTCDPGERSAGPLQRCFELCGVTRNVCSGSIATGSSRYRFSVPTRWLVDPAGGQCLAASGRRAVFMLVNGEVVALSPRRVRYDLLPPAAPRAIDVTNFEDRVDVSWAYGSSGSAATDAGVTDTGAATDVSDAGATDVTDAAVTDAAVTDAGSTATGGEEAIARFYVLCDPPPGTAPTTADAGDSCGGTALETLDVNDDAALARYRCAPATTSAARTASLVGVRSLLRYRVGVVAEDLAGNRSRVALSGVCASPSPRSDFWETYRASGGRGTPGLCAARPGHVGVSGASALAALVGATALRRRRRRPLG